MEPIRELSGIQVVRNSFMLLASQHPTITPDRVAHLADDLLDWDKLVKTDFVKEWESSAREQMARRDSLDQNFGAARLSYVCGPTTLQRMCERARRDPEAFGVLQCAFIMVGNLIADQIYDSHRELACTIQRQVNSFWNASANQALAELSLEGKAVVAILPEYNPTPPELKDNK